MANGNPCGIVVKRLEAAVSSRTVGPVIRYTDLRIAVAEARTMGLDEAWRVRDPGGVDRVLALRRTHAEAG